ncbi:MAG TPA: MlaD family protein [Rhodocyclaceae bacterium]|nr:MlaD family protein [Rhodocyclaceae bacterium]
MENRAHALAAGLFVLILGLATALAIWWFRQDRDEKAYYLLETNKSVGGLNVEAAVRYRGIRAGKVVSIGVDPKDARLIIVRISLDDDYKLTRGTTASLASQGITGLTFIALEDDGSDMTPLTAPEGELPRLALHRTKFEALTENAGEVLAGVDQLLEKLNRVLDDKNIASLNRGVENLSKASESLGELPAVMAGLRQALSPENMQRLNKTLANLEATSEEARPMVKDARVLIGNLNSLSERAEVLLGSGEAAHATLPRANALMKELTDTTRQLSRLLESLDDNPQALIFGRPPAKPGPGERGFGAPQPQTQP